MCSYKSLALKWRRVDEETEIIPAGPQGFPVIINIFKCDLDDKCAVVQDVQFILFSRHVYRSGILPLVNLHGFMASVHLLIYLVRIASIEQNHEFLVWLLA